MAAITFRKVIDFAKFPTSWGFVTLAADWDGSPIALFADGKPSRPNAAAIAETPGALWDWYRIPAKAHYGVHLQGSEPHTICFDRPLEIRPHHIQRLVDGWLLAESRGGRAAVYDQSGHFLRSLNLGDGIEDIQTTPNDQIWVSYFDEGVYGSEIGRYGAVCFDYHGNLQFKYGEFAERHGLPYIDDCYAMNVNGAGDVWLSYYSDFPLVHLHDFVLEHAWANFGAMGKGFAVRDEVVVYLWEGQLFSAHLRSPKTPEILQTLDESGVTLLQLPKRSLEYALRGPWLAMNLGSAVYLSL